jgi:hypothetical protein
MAQAAAEGTTPAALVLEVVAVASSSMDGGRPPMVALAPLLALVPLASFMSNTDRRSADMALYSINGSYPAPLPFTIFLKDGRSRTDPTTFTTAEIADAGFVGPFEQPSLGADEVEVWDGKVLSKRKLTAEEIALREEAAKPLVLSSITNFQARAALLQAGLFNQVNDALLALPADSAERQAWEYANELTRHGTLVNAVTADLGINQAQLDDLFRVGATIEA